MAVSKMQEFLDRVLAAVPEDKREALRSEYSAASDQVRSLDDALARVNKTATDQTEWWNVNKAALEEYKTLKAGGGPTPVDANAIEKAVSDLREEVMGNGLALVTTASTIAARHLNEFNEPLDMVQLAKDAIKANQTLDQYYTVLVAPRRQERAEAARKKEIEEAEARGLKKGVEDTEKRFGAQAMPFPSRTASPTTLSGLKKAEGAPDTLSAAVATANEVMVRQAG